MAIKLTKKDSKVPHIHTETKITSKTGSLYTTYCVSRIILSPIRIITRDVEIRKIMIYS